MTNPLRIEPARPQHAGVLLSLVRELARFEKLEHQVVATEDRIRDELGAARPVIEASIAWQDGGNDGGDGPAAVGFALYFHNFSTFLGRRGLYLEDLYVVPRARRQGVGRALLRHAEKRLREAGSGTVSLTVFEANERARRLYAKAGYAPDGSTRVEPEYEATEIRLVKALS